MKGEGPAPGEGLFKLYHGVLLTTKHAPPREWTDIVLQHKSGQWIALGNSLINMGHLLFQA